MSTLVQFRPALVMAAAGAALAGSLAVAGTASAAPRSHVARTALTVRPSRAPGLARSAPGTRRSPRGIAAFDWPMFRADPGHSGVSPETAISTTTASSLTARWTAQARHHPATPRPPWPRVALGEALVYVGRAAPPLRLPGGPVAPRSGASSCPPGVVLSPRLRWPAASCTSVSTAGAIYALNASTGAPMCSFTTGQLILASPVVVSAPMGQGRWSTTGTIPGGSGSGAEWAMYGPGNTHGACTKDWEFTSWAVSPGGSWSSPAYGMGANRVTRWSCSAAKTATTPSTRSTPTRARGSGATRRAPRPTSPCGRPPDHLPARAATASPTASST